MSLEVRVAASFTPTPLWSSDLAPCSAGQVLEVVAEPTAPKLDYKALLGGVPSEITQVDKQAQKKEAARLKVEREQARQQVGPYLCPLWIFPGHGSEQKLNAARPHDYRIGCCNCPQHCQFCYLCRS